MNNWRCPYCGKSISKPQWTVHQTLPYRLPHQNMPTLLLTGRMFCWELLNSHLVMPSCWKDEKEILSVQPWGLHIR
jgi:hypothetical protein